MTDPTTPGRDDVDAPTTHFAAPERADASTLRGEIEAAANSPVMTALLTTFGTLLAVLNRQRQIVAVNRPLVAHLGLDDGSLATGLRPGEALGCAFADEAPSGCGTGHACRGCGAGVAIVTSARDGRPVESECLLAVRREGVEESYEFRVRAVPLDVDGETFTVLSLQDIREQKRREAVERVFFHDVMNELQALTSYVDLLAMTGPEAAWRHVPAMQRLTHRLAREVVAQRDFVLLERGEYQPAFEPVRIGELWEVLTDTFAQHRVADGRTLQLDHPTVDLAFPADRALLERVLENMAKNALEATERGGEVRMGCETRGDTLRIACWNRAAIPADDQARIFQRFFSTREGTGRGLGTYGMKLLGERYLGGRVGFTSTDADGTEFFIELPLDRAAS